MNKITILTPTFNRAWLLEKLYISLERQTCKDFIWLIIDDGSTDNTRDLVDNFISISNFEIEYHYKKNGGKHTALNYSYKFLKTDYVIIVDSDDVLVNGAVKLILEKWSEYENIESLCGLFFLRGFNEKEIIGNAYPEPNRIISYIDYINCKKTKGDKAYVFRSKVLVKYKFPIYRNERFLGEGVVWSQIARDDYKIITINEIIYITQYLSDGLTKAGRKMRLLNPLGGMKYSKAFLYKCFSKRIRVKNALLYNVYSIFNKTETTVILDEDQDLVLVHLLFLPSYFISKCWKYKYKL